MIISYLVPDLNIALMKQQSNMLKLTLLLVSSLTILSVITISPALPENGFADDPGI